MVMMPISRPIFGLITLVLLAACGQGGDPSDEAAGARGDQPPTPTPSGFQAVQLPGVELGGEQLFLACAACHSLKAGEPHKVGPNLHGIAGQPAATRPEFDYSPALTAAGKEQGLVWDKGSLMAWVVQTEGLVPGSWMLYYNTLSGDEVQRLVDYILEKAGS